MIRKADQMIAELCPNMRGGTGTVTIEKMFLPEEMTANSRLCARLTLPPGASIGSHQHLKEDEVYVITQGCGILDDGQCETLVSVGDAVLTGNGESHSIRNDGDAPLEITAVIMCY
ncbi:MAG: cupin domain-containing protein [Verrucomicrobia bacterium]|nr:cupin domain-containing protein [Verrucomicrobiota bacterium]